MPVNPDPGVSPTSLGTTSSWSSDGRFSPPSVAGYAVAMAQVPSVRVSPRASSRRRLSRGGAGVQPVVVLG